MELIYALACLLACLLASNCFPSCRWFAANPGDLPIFLARTKKDLDQRRLDMSLGLVLLRHG